MNGYPRFSKICFSHIVINCAKFPPVLVGTILKGTPLFKRIARAVQMESCMTTALCQCEGTALRSTSAAEVQIHTKLSHS